MLFLSYVWLHYNSRMGNRQFTEYKYNAGKAFPALQPKKPFTLAFHVPNSCRFFQPFFIRHFSPSKAKPYFRMLSGRMPFCSRSVSYLFSSVCLRAFFAVSSRLFSSSSLSSPSCTARWAPQGAPQFRNRGRM